MQRLGPRGYLTDEEKANLPTVTWPLIKRILSYLTPYWTRFLLVFATILISAVLVVMYVPMELYRRSKRKLPVTV